MLELRDVKAGYGREEVIRGVSLVVPAGDVVGLAGINGAGKSTLLQCCSGHVPYSRGAITWNGGDLASGNPWTRVGSGVAYLAQDCAFFPHLTVAEHVRAAAACGRRPVSECEAEMTEWMPSLRVAANVLAGSLSGGEVRALSLGLVMAFRPKLLLLDEPSIGLDKMACERMLKRLKEAARKSRLAVLIAEQDLDGMCAIADCVHVLRAGLVIASFDAASLSADAVVRSF